MGNTWEVQLWCIKDMSDGSEDWGWDTIYRGESLEEVIQIAVLKKKETDGAIKIIWR